MLFEPLLFVANGRRHLFRTATSGENERTNYPAGDRRIYRRVIEVDERGGGRLFIGNVPVTFRDVYARISMRTYVIRTRGHRKHTTTTTTTANGGKRDAGRRSGR